MSKRANAATGHLEIAVMSCTVSNPTIHKPDSCESSVENLLGPTASTPGYWNWRDAILSETSCQLKVCKCCADESPFLPSSTHCQHQPSSCDRPVKASIESSQQFRGAYVRDTELLAKIGQGNSSFYIRIKHFIRDKSCTTCLGPSCNPTIGNPDKFCFGTVLKLGICICPSHHSLENLDDWRCHSRHNRTCSGGLKPLDPIYQFRWVVNLVTYSINQGQACSPEVV